MRSRATKLFVLCGCMILFLPFAVIARRAAGLPKVTFDVDVQPIFDRNCVICHRDDDPLAGLSLERGEAYDQIVRVPATEAPIFRIKPGTPEQSYLLLKVEGRHVPLGTGLRMPTLVFNQLTSVEVKRISLWISQGARRN